TASRWRIAPAPFGANDPHGSAARLAEPSGAKVSLSAIREWANPEADLFAGGGQRFTVEVVRCRGGIAVAPILMEVNREAGVVAVSSGGGDRARARGAGGA